MIRDHRTPRFTGLLKAKLLKCMGIYRSSIKRLTNAHKQSWVIKLNTASQRHPQPSLWGLCLLPWLFLCILTVLSDPASIPWLDKPILVPSHSSDKFDESALHCWRNFKILFPGVVTLNKRRMDWEQNCCKTVFLIKGFHWWPCYRNPLLNYFAPKVSKSTSKYTLAGVISLGELQMNKETKKKKYVNLTLCLALSDTPMINK